MDRFVTSAVAGGAECLLEFHEDASWDVQSARTLCKVAKLHEVFERKDMVAKLPHEFEALALYRASLLPYPGRPGPAGSVDALFTSQG